MSEPSYDPSSDDDAVDTGRMDADEGEPDITPFQPDDDPPSDDPRGRHGYGYE
ncbi:hypothetical protein [Jatrophihabitans endophyticus]|uniref:hypothetical protein n=1 Tax=Jatrophihabitans endophyticus TaxID=1206085 RepID=UPI0019FB348B|nr:hypothetical protein [Jatrophihabitans endophyticus]MBE7188476.1 hypothetical protein [Jatrophihabitans endophyticus]